MRWIKEATQNTAEDIQDDSLQEEPYNTIDLTLSESLFKCIRHISKDVDRAALLSDYNKLKDGTNGRMVLQIIHNRFSREATRIVHFSTPDLLNMSQTGCSKYSDLEQWVDRFETAIQDLSEQGNRLPEPMQNQLLCNGLSKCAKVATLLELHKDDETKESKDLILRIRNKLKSHSRIFQPGKKR